jgi:L-alanine-DL-glutamate epimerase-like enolase superfamily enzyme
MKSMEIKEVETLLFKVEDFSTALMRENEFGGIVIAREVGLLKIVTDEDITGCCFIRAHPRAMIEVIDYVFKPILLGEDPLYRERIWKKMWVARRLSYSPRSLRHFPERDMSSVDVALWDIAGKNVGLPIYKLLGAYRDKVNAYASTADAGTPGLSTPKDYADFAEQCMEKGYTAYKIHPWGDPNWDVAICKAVRERVGDEMVLLLDPFSSYDLNEAIYVGRELEKLDFYWLEEPMFEYNMSAYIKLASALDIPILGPETLEGNIYTRAEWILRGASDISRGGIGDVGGITPLMKLVHLCESFGVRMEVHGGGAGHLQVLGAMAIPGEYYERGLLHPLRDYEKPAPWLKEIIDPMDNNGYVLMPQKPGLGLDINWDYIEDNTIENL